jgi:hypothetical protein
MVVIVLGVPPAYDNVTLKLAVPSPEARMR